VNRQRFSFIRQYRRCRDFSRTRNVYHSQKKSTESFCCQNEKQARPVYWRISGEPV